MDLAAVRAVGADLKLGVQAAHDLGLQGDGRAGSHDAADGAGVASCDEDGDGGARHVGGDGEHHNQEALEVGQGQGQQVVGQGDVNARLAAVISLNAQQARHSG